MSPKKKDHIQNVLMSLCLQIWNVAKNNIFLNSFKKIIPGLILTSLVAYISVSISYLFLIGSVAIAIIIGIIIGGTILIITIFIRVRRDNKMIKSALTEQEEY